TFAPDSRTLASTSDDRTLRLWDLARKEQLAEFQCADLVDSAAFSPDGKLVAAGCWGVEFVQIWDIATRRQVIDPQVKEPLQGLRVHFSPDGTLLASSSRDTVRLWDVATWQNVATFKGHTAEVLCFGFMRNGQFLATGDAAGTLGLWDLAEKRRVEIRRGHTS